MRWTVPLLLQCEGSRFTRNLGFNLATSPCKTFGMVCLSSSSYFRFRGEAMGALCKTQPTKAPGENVPALHSLNISHVQKEKLQVMPIQKPIWFLKSFHKNVFPQAMSPWGPWYWRDGLPVNRGHRRHEGPVQGMVEHWGADVGQNSIQQGLTQVLLLRRGHWGRWWSRLKHNRSPFSFNHHKNRSIYYWFWKVL